MLDETSYIICRAPSKMMRSLVKKKKKSKNFKMVTGQHQTKHGDLLCVDLCDCTSHIHEASPAIGWK